MRTGPLLTKFATYIFYVLFFATATLSCIAVIFYSSGYRYNFATHTIQRTGLLVITQMPEGATTLINNEPASLKNSRILPAFGPLSYSTILLPGSYDLSITKPGHYSYNQNITVEPELITKIENIYLLPLQIPGEETAMISNPHALSGGILAHYQPGKGAAITTVLGDTTPYTLPPNTQILSYQWSDNLRYLSYHILDGSIHDIGIIEANGQRPPMRLSEQFDFVPMPERFAVTNSGHILSSTQDTLYILDTSTSQANIIDTHVHTFSLTDEVAFYTKTDGSIHTFHLNSRKIAPLSIPLNTISDTITVTHTQSTYLILAGKKLFATDGNSYVKVIDTGIDSIITPAPQSTDVYYVKNSFEIVKYNTSSRTTTFVTRTSNRFDEAFELPELPYIIFRSGDHIKIMKNDGTNTVTIFTDPAYSIYQLSLDASYHATLILASTQDPTQLKTVVLTLPEKP